MDDSKANGVLAWLLVAAALGFSPVSAVSQEDSSPSAPDPNDARQYRISTFNNNPDPKDLFLSPSLEISGFAGESLSAADLRGRVVLFEFWWSGCVYGVGPVSYLKSLTRDLADKPFILISVNVDGDTDEMRQYRKKYNMDWPQYRHSSELRMQFGIDGYPTHILVDHEGTIILHESGWSSLVETRLDWEIGRALRAARAATPP